jgi:hypothetical protein
MIGCNEGPAEAQIPHFSNRILNGTKVAQANCQTIGFIVGCVHAKRTHHFKRVYVSPNEFLRHCRFTRTACFEVPLSFLSDQFADMAKALPVIEASVLETLNSPMMVIFRDRLQANLDSMLVMAGHPSRLRPHCKTHKMEHIIRMWVEQGVTKHKAATIAECEMLAAAGATDILFAYNPVGPEYQPRGRFGDQVSGMSNFRDDGSRRTAADYCRRQRTKRMSPSELCST